MGAPVYQGVAGVLLLLLPVSTMMRPRPYHWLVPRGCGVAARHVVRSPQRYSCISVDPPHGEQNVEPGMADWPLGQEYWADPTHQLPAGQVWHESLLDVYWPLGHGATHAPVLICR